ncbi:PREDICTED: uncharacterized protein LOC105461279 [Wasmannia auropunctata]|uniref:uncharacterized protein LOC105461279 n=1 Tax=Wasmannia auropunctata TaxID=64793 RepID=UPI0005EDCEFC|nr:PREDICTED: uncharacterized protein LOC105461279 [Wasmannia auropunctata]
MSRKLFDICRVMSRNSFDIATVIFLTSFVRDGADLLRAMINTRPTTSQTTFDHHDHHTPSIALMVGLRNGRLTRQLHTPTGNQPRFCVEQLCSDDARTTSKRQVIRSYN